MAYESPITLIRAQTDNFVKEINEKTDEVIFKAVINVLPQVDKDELIKALAYDREQYAKGYQDRDSEIVRCKDCHFAEYDITHMYCVYFGHKVYGEDYCSNAVERKGGEDE